jgi:hypothetical protein
MRLITKTMVLGFAALMMLTNPAVSASKEGITFYIQLVQGTDADMPPATGATLIGDALNRRLQMFRWKNYWEIQRQTVELSAGAKVRRPILRKHEVEIALPTPTDMTVSIYLDGKLTRKRAQPVDTAFYIAGGDNDEKSESWFIVIRRDKPQNAPATAGRAPVSSPNQCLCKGNNPPGSATVPLSLAGVMPGNSMMISRTPNGAKSNTANVFGGTPKTAVETTALPKATESFRLSQLVVKR